MHSVTKKPPQKCQHSLSRRPPFGEANRTGSASRLRCGQGSECRLGTRSLERFPPMACSFRRCARRGDSERLFSDALSGQRSGVERDLVISCRRWRTIQFSCRKDPWRGQRFCLSWNRCMSFTSKNDLALADLWFEHTAKPGPPPFRILFLPSQLEIRIILNKT